MACKASRYRQNTKNGKKTNDSNGFVVKSTIQSIAALMIFLIVWGMTLSSHPAINDMCNRIKHYLTYSYDVQSVFNNFYNVPEVNDDTH